MKQLSALMYYITSFFTLIFKTHFWQIPFVLIKKPLLFSFFDGRQFYVNSLIDIWTLKEVLLDKQYKLYDSPEKTWNVVDIGTGVADFAVMISPSVHHVFAFDGDDNRIALSKKNVSLHKRKNITLGKERIQNIDDVLKKYKIDRCDLLKIDCEGCEYPVLLDAKKQSLKKIDRIIMEVHLFTPGMRSKFKSLKKMLEQEGFTLIEKPNPVHSYLRFVYAYRV